MGTDIHLVAEKRVNGVWVNATEFHTPSWASEGEPPVLNQDQYFHDRNYDVFAILADVRNGSGFAGVDTGDGFKVIAEPKGLPTDMSPEVAAFMEEIDHTPSWLTVAEIMAFDWTQVTRKRGITGSLTQIGRWKQSGSPDSYSGGVSGPGVKTVAMSKTIEARFETLFKQVPGEPFTWWSLYHAGDEWGAAAKDEDKQLAAFRTLLRAEFSCENPHFLLEWETPYYEPASRFLSMTLPKLWRLGAPEDVRVVFYFDS